MLDNCEHVFSACQDLADTLLRACPHLRMLATSREALGVDGEVTYRVPSLQLPDLRRLPPPVTLVEYEAIRLFAERAALSQAGFSLTASNAASVAQICHRLGGIPLAIEFAAARVKVLSVDQIATRLDDRFRLLTAGTRKTLPRHQTLRATMDWSYDLLSEAERAILRRLSVFAGGWTLQAAEAVCTGRGLDTAETLDLLTRLVDKSLVIADVQDAAPRYRLLQTVRQYGRDRLFESDEAELVLEQHRNFFLALAEEADTHVGGPNERMWLDRVEAEHDNLRTALDWSLEAGETEAAGRLVKACERLWTVRGYYSEAHQRLEAFLSAAGDEPSSLRAWALDAAGSMARRLGDVQRAVSLFEQSVAVYRALGDTSGAASALSNFGIASYRQGRYARAAALVEEALAQRSANSADRAFELYLLGVIARLRGEYEKAASLCKESLAMNEALGHKRHMAQALDGLGLVALCQGDYKQAQSLCEQALTLHRKEGYKYGCGASLNSLGLVACVQGDYDRARALCEESLALWQDQGTGDKGIVARSLYILGRVAAHRGDHEAAVARLVECLRLFRELGEKLGVTQCLERLGVLAANSAPERSARLFAAAEGIRDEIDAPLPVYDRVDRDPAVASDRAALGERLFESTWAEGRAMTLEQAIDYALTTESG